MNMVDDASGDTLARMGSEETIWAAAGVLRAWVEKYGVPVALVYGLEECVCARGEHEGAIAGGGAGDAIWPDVPAPGAVSYTHLTLPTNREV